MDGKRFDDLSRRLASQQSRRRFFGLIGVAATGILTQQTAGAAPKADKPKKCYGEGSHCTNGKQCCSNTCTNRKCTAGGSVSACTTAAECAGVDTECQMRTCVGGICGVEYAPFGFPVTEQIAGDCQQDVCNGTGGVTNVPDDFDNPISANDCMFGICIGGEQSETPRPVGEQCATNGGSVCDGYGQCVVCLPGEMLPCYSGSAETEGVGVCRAGTMTCLEDGSGFGECIGEVPPSVETCNGLDDDCDGRIDVGIPEVGSRCTIDLPDGLPANCEEGTVECIEGEFRCCLPDCFGPGAPYCF